MNKLSTVALAASVLASGLAAQNVTHQNLTEWSHNGAPATWIDDYVDATAEFGTCDRLVSANDVSILSTPYVLDPGIYVANVRLRKFQDATGAADFDLLALGGRNGVDQVTSLATDHTVDEWVHTPSVVFEVTQPSTVVTLVLNNGDTTLTKQNYDFDAVRLGKVDAGPVVACESMALSWGHAWGSPYYVGLQDDADAIYGAAEELNYVWWLEWNSPQYVLQPGTYSANVRVKKMSSASGRYPLEMRVNLGNLGTPVVTWEAADQPIDEYAYSPDLSFDITQPDTVVRFNFRNIDTGVTKNDYRFDTFILRRGAYDVSNIGCASSLGLVDIAATPPMIDQLHRVEASGVPGNGWLAYGATSPTIDLSVIGAPGCSVFTSANFLLPFVGDANGEATLEFRIPNLPSLAGSQFYQQIIALDLQANSLGIATSARGRGQFSL